MADNTSLKRSRSPNGDDESSDDDFGPALPSSVPPKKRRKLPYESLYISALPRGIRYSKSLMHKEQLFSVTVAPAPSDFVITTSVDGVVKFWKKAVSGIEFVKEFQAHEGAIKSISISADGGLFASAGDDEDRTIKLFDVASFDLLSILNVEQSPSSVCWVSRKGSTPLLAVALGKAIRIYDGAGEKQESLHSLKSLHRADVVAMVYNAAYDCVISADASGAVEYWQPREPFEKPDNVFKMKSTTNLFDFKKAKSAPCCIAISASGHQFATYSFPDRKVRIFDFATAKLHRSYDESIETITTMHDAGTALIKLDEAEFRRRMAVETNLDTPATRSKINITFDESGHFVAYGSLYGIKVVNTLTNRVVRTYGKDEPFRALNVAVYQGAPQKKGVVTVSMAASANPLLEEAEERDPILFTTAYAKVRFYMFTNEESVSKSSRDVHNEKPRHVASKRKEEKQALVSSNAIIHTSMGDISLKLYPDQTPKTVENFVTHARNGYYNNTIFHRVIRKFMIQCGDPLGDGTGGESIWGKEFEDEIVGELRHDKPYILSMANAGPNTNGSQFFITTEKAPWLDGKHTIFGRVTKGFEVVHAIENTRVLKEKPEEDIKIVNISGGD
ncbi:hypothetical protein DV736_g83, partial [Chaetothyriales sp. CBS 134916]